MDTLLTSKAQVRERIAALRGIMKSQGIDAYLVPSADPHLSEYLPERWQARQYLSGFTGSMGTLIVWADGAGVWADSRYWVQAENELSGTSIELMKIPTGSATLHIDWLATHLNAGQVVGVDGAVLGLASHRQLDQLLSSKSIKLRTDCDLMDAVWPARPGLPAAAVYEHLAPHATSTRADKLALVREQMQRMGAATHFLSTVDDIAWLLNLRGSDVNYNPVFIAHALVTLDKAQLFIAPGKVNDALSASLRADGVQVLPYAQCTAHLGKLTGTVLIDPRRVTYGLRQAINAEAKIIESINPSTLAKSRKSAAEAEHVREAMRQDAAAMAEFYAWFENVIDQKSGKERITELTIDEKLTAARARRPGFVSPSFGTIAAFNANGAMPHYHATNESHAVIEGDGLLLIDSGGQYLGGTTDITRVWPIGKISDEHKRDYTRVLKGTIALSRTQFPRGTLSPMLDAIARAPLWEASLDYGHGTGHGVGYFMNVHEGPQSISKAITEPHMAMEPGMITSIEPGLYRPGKWGIRIENLVLNVATQTNEFGEFLKFETLTLCPIDTRLIDKTLMSAEETAWLNAYHAMVLERVSPLVQGDAKAWLEKRCQSI
jgi:Xaa-Pro aminopeptidase